jgi:hypothetical protein
MERGEEIRLEALRALTILAVHDEEFRREMWDDPEGTLERYGFALSPAEMAQVNNFLYAVRESVDVDLFEGLTDAHR